MEDFSKTGKIQNNSFKSQVFPYLGRARSEVTLGPEFGVDIGIVSIGNGLAMAITSDPLSLIPTLGLRESAWLSVQLMANDMATTGFAPMYAQFVLNLPATLNEEDFAQYWKHIHEYCEQLGVAITGGHTGRFDGLTSTVSGGGTMIAIVPDKQIITSKGAQPGDIVIMTQECALLSTAILALSFPKTVKKNCGEETYRKACDLFYKTSAVQAGLVAGEIGRLSKSVSAMHDVTEGGILGALYELAQASSCGIDIDETKIPVGETQEKIGNLFGVDPKYCIGAGSMIITTKPDIYELLISRLLAENIQATVIGSVVTRQHGVTSKTTQGKKNVTHLHTDPYWSAFFSAYNKGWT